MLSYSFLLLQMAAPSAGGSFLTGLLPIVLMVAIFYFLVFMPMRRQQRNQKQMLAQLQNGQTVADQRRNHRHDCGRER